MKHREMHKVFGIWFIIFLIWAFYRAYFLLPEWVDELLIKPLVFVLPVVYLVVVRERKKFTTIGFASKPFDIAGDFYFGVVIGILFAFEGILANYFKYGRLAFTPIDAFTTGGGVVQFLLLSLITSVSEEILGRGFMYQRLYQASGKQFWAATSSSFLFLLLHIPILFTRLTLMGTSVIVYPLSIFLLGITNCYLFSMRKSLTLPILLHTFWNMTVALYL